MVGLMFDTYIVYHLPATLNRETPASSTTCTYARARSLKIYTESCVLYFREIRHVRGMRWSRALDRQLLWRAWGGAWLKTINSLERVRQIRQINLIQNAHMDNWLSIKDNIIDCTKIIGNNIIFNYIST